MSLARGESLRAVSKRYNLSRNTVRKIARSDETEFRYPKRAPRYPALGPVMESLAERLAADEEAPVSRRRSGRKLFEELVSEGYEGGYDSVRRYVKFWKDSRSSGLRSAFVPLDFAKGEAFQFDWSEETVELGGVCHKLQVAQVRLCHSRMRFCMAFPRQELPMLIAAHVRAHDFFGGLCLRGIYDNAKTVVDKIGRGKERVFNQRFLQLSSHYLFEPEACTPAAGWEKGQVENQVKSNRQSVFVPRLRFESLSELNAHLAEQMIVEAHHLKHPQMTRILSAIPVYGLEAVSVACETALESGAVSQSVVLNHLSRLTEEPAAEALCPPPRLVLRIEPTADCFVYDRLLGGEHVA